MSLSNLGGDVGSYFGVLIIKILGLSRDNYDALPLTVLIKSFCKGLIIVLIFVLVPDARPSDPLLSSAHPGKEDGDLEDDRRRRLSAPAPALEMVNTVLQDPGHHAL